MTTQKTSLIAFLTTLMFLGCVGQEDSSSTSDISTTSHPTSEDTSVTTGTTKRTVDSLYNPDESDGVLAENGVDRTVERPTSALTQPTVAEDLDDSGNDAIAGAALDPTRSLFRLGAGVHSDQSAEFSRLVGDEGVIAMGNHGVLLSVPNADAPSTTAPPLSTDANVHARRVVEYVVAMGVPEDQLGTLHNHASVTSSGAVMDLLDGIEGVQRLVGYYTVVDRSVAGFRIGGSYAWARFNDRDEVVSEEIFWPQLPKSLLAEAAALQRNKAEVIARLPLDLQARADEAEVVIHHSPHFQESFESFVSLDFPGEGDGPEQRFGLDGLSRRFEFESVPPDGDPKADP